MLPNSMSETLARTWRSLARPIPPGVVRTLARALFSRSWSRFEQAARDPAQAQLQRLLQIIERNRDTEFGRRHGFARIRSVADYQRQVPIQAYEDLEPAILRMTRGEADVLTAQPVIYFGRTSGTTGEAKYIPVTEDFLDEYRHGRRVWTRQVILAFPGLVHGSVFTVRSTSIDGTTPAGIPYGPIGIPLGKRTGTTGSLTGLLRRMEPIPDAAFSIPDYEARYYTLLRIAVATNVSLLATINPSTLALLCRKLSEWAEPLSRDCRDGRLRRDLDLPAGLREQLEGRLRPAPTAARRLERSLASHGRVRPVDLWPDLCGLLCWKGGNAPFYLDQFPTWFADLPVMDYCYAATEGNFNVVLSAQGRAGPIAAAGHFMEFVPDGQDNRDDGRALTVAQLERGQRYRVVLTASNGLYRYDLNDLIEVTGFYHRTPQVAFLSKGSKVVSFTGEKLYECQVTAAISTALAGSGIRLVGFCVGVQTIASVPRYVLAVEPAGSPARRDLVRLLLRWEAALQAGNLEYRAKRVSLRLGNPVLRVTAAGAFDAWRRRQVERGAPDGQVKLPNLCSEPDVLARLGTETLIEMEEDK